MSTLTLTGPRISVRRRKVSFSRLRPYVGRPHNCDPERKELPALPRMILTLQEHRKLQRHNSLNLALQPTHRMLLRWGESGGNGLPNPEAEVRELHYDPLPPELHEAVDGIVDGSPWELLTRKWYRTNLTNKELAELLCVGRRQLYTDWNASLWYFRGRFEETGLHE